MIPSASNRIISVGFINHLPRFCWCLYQITKKQFTIARVLSVFLNTKQNFFSTVRSVSSYQRIKGTENFWIYLIIGYAFLQFVIDFPKYNAISRIGTLGQLFYQVARFLCRKAPPFLLFRRSAALTWNEVWPMKEWTSYLNLELRMVNKDLQWKWNYILLLVSRIWHQIKSSNKNLKWLSIVVLFSKFSMLGLSSSIFLI